MIRLKFFKNTAFRKYIAAGLVSVMLLGSAEPMTAAVRAADSSSEETPGQESTDSEPTETPPAPAPQEEGGTQTPDPAPSQEPGGDAGQSEPEQTPGQEGQQTEAGTGTEEGDPAQQEPGLGETTGEGIEEETEEEKKKEEEEKKKEEEEAVEAEEELREAELATGSNEDLYIGQTITSLPVVSLDFRFYHVDYSYSMARFRVYVREDMDESARVVGTIPAGGLLYVLEDLGDWAYVESGDVRGFASVEALYTAEETAAKLRDQEKALEEKNDQLVSPLGLLEQIQEAHVPAFGDICVPVEENGALTYTKATGRDILDKEYAYAAEDVRIREGMGKNYRPVGFLPEGGVCYILTREENGYVFVESGDVRGFVKESKLVEGKRDGEDSAEAEELVDPSENKALFHTILSVKNGSRSAQKRQALIDLAKKCLGHAYVWGGIDPFGYGADCSGFVQTVYKAIGINLPRVAQDQAYYGGGIKIPVSDAAPGDLIFFAMNGYIYHVAMCYDNNNGSPTTIEALGRNYGICYYHTAGRRTIWALRILD